MSQSDRDKLENAANFLEYEAGILRREGRPQSADWGEAHAIGIREVLGSTSDDISNFIDLAKDWRLSVDQQIVLLGSPSRSTFFKWKKQGGKIPKDTVERIDNLLWMESRAWADAGWLHTTTRHLDYATPLQVMSRGRVADIFLVRQTLFGEFDPAELAALPETHNPKGCTPNGDNND